MNKKDKQFLSQWFNLSEEIYFPDVEAAKKEMKSEFSKKGHSEDEILEVERKISRLVNRHNMHLPSE